MDVGFKVYTAQAGPRGEDQAEAGIIDPDAEYVDLGCNTEIYTDWDILEMETLGGRVPVLPGNSVEHLEKWYLFKTDRKEDEGSLDNDLMPLIGRTAL